jgi:hypothetical protein
MWATRFAAAIVGQFGMNGSLYFTGALGDAPDPKVKREVERILDDQFKKVKALLVEYREPADEIVRLLLEKGDVLGDEIIDIIKEFDQRRNGHEPPAGAEQPPGAADVAAGSPSSPSGSWAWPPLFPTDSSEQGSAAS